MPIQRISIDPGGEKYLGFAKKKLNQLKERLAGVLDFGKQKFLFDGFRIYISFQNGIDEIQIKGIVKYGLVLIYIRNTNTASISLAFTGLLSGAVLKVAAAKLFNYLNIDSKSDIGVNVLAQQRTIIVPNISSIAKAKSIQSDISAFGITTEIVGIDSESGNANIGEDYGLVYDDATVGAKGGDYRALTYSFDKDLKKLTPTGLIGKSLLSIADTGCTLVVQSGQGKYLAELPSIFAIENNITNCEGLKTSWTSTITFFETQDRIVGSRYINGWKSTSAGYKEDKTTFANYTSARHGFRSEKGIIKTGWYHVEQVFHSSIAPLIEDMALYVTDEHYQLWDSYINYRTTPSGNIIRGALIGSDYITGELGVQPPTYKWKLHQPIDIFDENNCLTLVTTNEWVDSNSKLADYSLDFTATNRYYYENIEYALGHGGPEYGFYEIDSTYHYSGKYPVLDDTVIRTEKIMLGNETIFSCYCTIKREIQGNPGDGISFVWTPGAIPVMTLVSEGAAPLGQDGNPISGYGDGMRGATGAVSGYGIFNETIAPVGFTNPTTGRGNVRIPPVVIGFQSASSEKGTRNLKVLVIDNSNGINNYIMICQYDQIDLTNTYLIPNTNDGSYASPQVKTKGGKIGTYVVIKYVSPKSQGVIYAPSISSSHTQISGVSCQIGINGDFMAYTYCLNTLKGNGNDYAFSKRIVGLISMADDTKKEFELMDDDINLKDFAHFHAAAVGVL
ncbi:MAG: hypothetical protein HQK98_06535 [Nitrospirae bacterium]|nr:hypothetical protein [Nitrospirota bacterium]